jgi:hypothetical protein
MMISGGLLLALSYLVVLPIVITILGAALFMGGLGLIPFLAFRISRRTGAGVMTSVGRALRALGSVFWRFMP